MRRSGDLDVSEWDREDFGNGIVSVRNTNRSCYVAGRRLIHNFTAKIGSLEGSQRSPGVRGNPFREERS